MEKVNRAAVLFKGSCGQFDLFAMAFFGRDSQESPCTEAVRCIRLQIKSLDWTWAREC